MSLFIDLKYLKLISSQLPLFKQKNERLYNCRCILCGDSIKKKNKARGYFYVVKNDLLYKCHNCDVGMHFGTFLKSLNKLLYDQYILERFTTGLPANRAHNVIPEIFNKMPEPTFCDKNKILQNIAIKLSTLDENHNAIKYCENRKIPKNKYNELYYISDVNKLEALSHKYEGRINSNEARLVIPFYSAGKKLIAVTCRGINNEQLRYINIRLNDEVPMIYGLDKINTNKLIYVVEGPIDSMFLDNAIAVGGMGFSSLENTQLNKDNLVVIIDNEPRNKEEVKIYDNVIEKDYNIVIWPQTLQEKDINDMVLHNKKIDSIIKNNTFRGLEARLKFIGWKRV